MQEAAKIKETLEMWREEISSLEKRMAPLREDLDRAQAQVQKRSQALNEAQSEAARLQESYRVECRKLAAGQTSKALKFKTRLLEAEAKVDGLKQLLAEDQQEAGKAQGALAEPETKLAGYRANEQESATLLQVATAVEAVGKKLRAVLTEADSALEGFPFVHPDLRYRMTVETQRARLLRLKETLRLASMQYF